MRGCALDGRRLLVGRVSGWQLSMCCAGSNPTTARCPLSFCFGVCRSTATATATAARDARRDAAAIGVCRGGAAQAPRRRHVGAAAVHARRGDGNGSWACWALVLQMSQVPDRRNLAGTQTGTGIGCAASAPEATRGRKTAHASLRIVPSRARGARRGIRFAPVAGRLASEPRLGTASLRLAACSAPRDCLERATVLVLASRAAHVSSRALAMPRTRPPTTIPHTAAARDGALAQTFSSRPPPLT